MAKSVKIKNLKKLWERYDSLEIEILKLRKLENLFTGCERITIGFNYKSGGSHNLVIKRNDDILSSIFDDCLKKIIQKMIKLEKEQESLSLNSK